MCWCNKLIALQQHERHFCALPKETGNRNIQAKLNKQEFSKEAILTGKGSAQIRYLMQHKFTMKLKNCSSGPFTGKRTLQFKSDIESPLNSCGKPVSYGQRQYHYLKFTVHNSDQQMATESVNIGNN